MTQRFTYTQLLITSAAFAGGLALGLLFIPESNRRKRLDSISSQITELADWVDSRGKETIAQSASQVHQLRKNVRQHIRHHVPDFYEATEHIHLGESNPAGA